MRFLPIAMLGLVSCAPHAVPPASPPAAGVSYAWVVFDGARVRDSGAAGAADRGSGRALTIDDPVRIASISKLVVALGVLRLAEQGLLDLDQDVSIKLGWPLRNPAFPDRPITLRLLLSHRSSFKDDVDYAIPLGRDLQEVLANPVAFDTSRPPGGYFRYANVNFPVIASVMERATGERFDRLIDRLVLTPLSLDACFNWSTCDDLALARAVVLYDDDGSPVRDDLKGRRPTCLVVPNAKGGCDLGDYVPGTNGALFSPQGGLRISARDLATVGQLLINRGRHQGRAFLDEASIDALIKPAWRFDGSNGETEQGFFCSYGLATQTLPVPVAGCRDDLFGGGRAMVGHAGEAYRVRSGLWVDPMSGVGISFFATNNGTDPPRGRTAFRAVEEWLAAKLGGRQRLRSGSEEMKRIHPRLS